MRHLLVPNRLSIAVAVLLTLIGLCPAPAAADKSPVKITKLQGVADLSGEAPFPFVLEGIASHLGKFTAYGEVEFLPGEEEGSLLGTGVVVFEAANGDLLVGVVTWEIDPEVDGVAAVHVHFSWRDEVELSDGTIVSNTGRFVDDRPPGAAARLCKACLGNICFFYFC